MAWNEEPSDWSNINNCRIKYILKEIIIMNLRKLITASLLLAIGMILHQMTPPLVMGMKPDFSLAMMFIAIALCDDYKLTIVIGIAAGILAAATTTFPGGQLPNIIDKLITSQMAFLMFKIVKNKLNNQISMITVSIIGTLISGSVFLSSALFIVGLPAPFEVLFLTVVIPATAINTVASAVLYNIVNLSLKYSHLQV